jgi:hypothetical protein
MRAKHPLVLLLLLTLVPPPEAGAQQPGRVRVLRTAAVLEQPAGEAKPVATVNAGDVLEVLDERETWVLVRPPNGVSREWRTGWLNRATVESMSAGGAAATPATTTPNSPVAPPQDAEEPSARRKGFIIGFGAGAGMHKTPGFSVFDRFGRLISSGGGEYKLAIVTDFNIGYAPGDQILLFYSNKAAFTTDDRVDAVGVSGFGVTYMFRRTAPTSFVTGTIGAGAARTFIESSSSESGAGYAIGGGYEFARHFSLTGDAIFVRLGSGQNHTVYKASFNYLFY